MAAVQGFDGHVEDYYHYLSNESYEWVTLALEDCCPSGRVVSVLEGGYSLEARVPRSKAAQQARATAKRTPKPDATSDTGGSAASSTEAGSGPALRERRLRPATRGSTSSANGPSATSTNGGARGKLPAEASSGAASGLPASAAAAVVVPSARTRGAIGSGAVIPPEFSGGGAGLSPSSFSSSKPTDVAGAFAVPGTVPGNIPGTIPGNAPACRAVASVVGAAAAAAAVPPVSRGHVAVIGPPPPFPSAREATAPGGVVPKTESEPPVLKPEDGGLVRGLVSHVSALMRAASMGRARHGPIALAVKEKGGRPGGHCAGVGDRGGRRGTT